MRNISWSRREPLLRFSRADTNWTAPNEITPRKREIGENRSTSTFAYFDSFAVASHHRLARPLIGSIPSADAEPIIDA